MPKVQIIGFSCLYDFVQMFSIMQFTGDVNDCLIKEWTYKLPPPTKKLPKNTTQVIQLHSPTQVDRYYFPFWTLEGYTQNDLDDVFPIIIQVLLSQGWQPLLTREDESCSKSINVWIHSSSSVYDTTNSAVTRGPINVITVIDNFYIVDLLNIQSQSLKISSDNVPKSLIKHLSKATPRANQFAPGGGMMASVAKAIAVKMRPEIKIMDKSVNPKKNKATLDNHWVVECHVSLNTWVLSLETIRWMIQNGYRILHQKHGRVRLETLNLCWTNAPLTEMERFNRGPVKLTSVQS